MNKRESLKYPFVSFGGDTVNPLNAELNPVCHLLALLGAHNIFHVSGLRVNIAVSTVTRLWTGLDERGISFDLSAEFDVQVTMHRDKFL